MTNEEAAKRKIDLLDLVELDRRINLASGWGAATTAMIEERDRIARRLGKPLRRRFVRADRSPDTPR